MEDRKKILIGHSDFKDVIEKNFYYVDKTKLIENLLDKSFAVSLFLRPRRFGKTLNMSMLKYFFDKKNNAENSKLFDELYISKSKAFEKQGENPVIFLSFKDIKFSDWETSFREIRKVVSEIYKENLFLEEKLDKYSLIDFQNICLLKEEADWGNSLKNLSKYLTNYYGEKTVLLIDEYDTPIIYAQHNNYYDEMMSFIRHFYSSVLKDNEYLELSVMTGIMRVAKEGIFSGLNNVMVYDTLKDDYSECFGMLENEVEDVLKYYGLDYKIKEVQEWYNGYQFGKKRIYNPWSINNFLEEKELKGYWINTSNNETIYDYLELIDENTYEDLEKLFKNESIKKFIDDTVNFSNIDENVNETIWNLFLYSGYITTANEKKDGMYELKIPNKEVLEFFGRAFVQKVFRDESLFLKMIKNLKNLELQEFEENLQKLLERGVSHFDTSKNKIEQFYHGIFFGIASSLDSEYIIKSNRESGYGRFDLTLKPKVKNKNAYIFEFKSTENENTLENIAEKALNQINEKKYEIDLREEGITNIINIGIAFSGKKVKIKCNQ